MNSLLLPAERPWIIGHRGAAGEAPENTLAGIQRALDQGVDMLEVDVQLSADGELFVVHDWDLQRLAGKPLVVEEASSSLLRRTRLLGRTSQGEDEHAIPLLAEALAAVPPAFPLNIELKRRHADPGTLVESLARQVKRRQRVLISSFDWKLLELARDAVPRALLAPLARRDWRALLAAGQRLEAFSLHCHWRMARPRLIVAAAAHRRPLLVYTVNSRQGARGHFRRGIRGVFTDYPGRMHGVPEDLQ